MEGGVGWAATQLARTVENVKIYGVVSRGKENFVKNNGVDLVFTYENLEENLDKVGGFDLIIINQAGLEIKKYQQKLNPLGRLILLGKLLICFHFSFYQAFCRYKQFHKE